MNSRNTPHGNCTRSATKRDGEIALAMWKSKNNAIGNLPRTNLERLLEVLERKTGIGEGAILILIVAVSAPPIAPGIPRAKWEDETVLGFLEETALRIVSTGLSEMGLVEAKQELQTFAARHPQFSHDDISGFASRHVAGTNRLKSKRLMTLRVCPPPSVCSRS